MRLFAIVFAATMLVLLPTHKGMAMGSAAPAGNVTLWQLGRADDSSAEFSDYPPAGASAPAQTVDVPTDWSSRTDWKAIPKGLKGDRNPAVDIHYSLAAVPANGVLLSIKLLDAPQSGPQAAVFSNGLCAGILQLWGTSEGQSPYKWRKVYRLYIPKELLKHGDNILRFETVRPMYSDASADPRLWWEWDYVKIEALAQPVREPIHGTVCYLGTTLKQNYNEMFQIDDITVKMAPVVFSWLGIAYSGNTIRCDYWSDLPASMQPARLQYLEALRDLNMTALVDNVSGSNFALDPSGKIPDSVKGQVDTFFKTYGGLFQYYELGNEPCMFGGPGGYNEYVALAKYIDQIKQPTIKLTAPGWAYGGGQGKPINWDADTNRRRQVEQYCQTTNGHSYGYSYNDPNGGSFKKDMELYGNVEDGWPKEYLTSETGTNNWHSEDNGARFKSTQPNAEAFDRIMRAHIAVVDRTMQHASAFDDFGIFNDYLPKDDLSTLSVYPGVNGQDPRIKTYRRLALAYATHGAPLTYHYLNTSQLLDKKVYFRGVDTSAIPGQSGSNAVSNKLLLNFVNFESSPQTMTVQVTLPVTGAYHAERFGLGNTYAEAHSVMTLTAGPTVQITENLGPGESVQYILTPPKATKPYAPLNVDAEAEGSALAVRWSACANAIRYQVLRNSGGAATFKLVAEVMQPSYEDRQTEPGKKYAYGIVAVDSAGVSPESAVVTVTAGVPSPPLLVQPTPGDGSVSLAWDAVPGASKYQVSRSTKVFGPFSVVGQSPAPTFTDRNLTDGTIYYYQIRSANTAGLSGVAIAQGIPEAPLAPPTSLQAFPGDHRVTLHWTGVDRAMSYIVERSAAPDNKFVALPDLISSPDWVDVTTLNDVDYQYRIASRGVAVVGAFSPAISATPNADPVIAPWHQADIGIVGTPGTASLTENPVGITLAGSGDNLWGTADSFHFLYQDLSGDGSLTAHIVSFDNTDPFATVGVMIRETLTAGSRMVAMGITPSHGCGFPHRDDTGAQCDFAGGPALRWVRIERKGSLITGYVSNDGQSWQKIGQVQSTMPPNTLIGLVACSHTHALDTAQLSDITLVK